MKGSNAEYLSSDSTPQLFISVDLFVYELSVIQMIMSTYYDEVEPSSSKATRSAATD